MHAHIHFSYYTATILYMSGVKDVSQAVLLSCAVSGVNFVFTFVATALIERKGRRFLLLASISGAHKIHTHNRLRAGIILCLAFLGGGFMVIGNTSVKVLNTTYPLEEEWKNVIDTDGDQRNLYDTAEFCRKQT